MTTTLGPMDVQQLRSETPGCTDRIHLNNAGAALMPTPVIDAIHGHLDLEIHTGGYEAAEASQDEIETAYEAVASLVGAESHNIAFTENATISYIQALSSVPYEPGDIILTTRNDYVSNQIHFLSLQSRLGVRVVRAPDTPEGGVDVSAVEELIRRERPRIVCVTHVPTSSGLVQDVAAVGTICRETETLYLVDGCQSVGQIPIDVAAIGCDFFSSTSRKFLRGPRGSGFLFVADRVLASGLEPLFIDLKGADWIGEDQYRPRSDARRFENWEFAWSLVLGTGAAATYALAIGVEEIQTRASGLAATLRDAFSAIDGVRVLDRGAELCAIVTAWVDGWSPPDLVEELQNRGINTWKQERIDSVIHYDESNVAGSLRISPHYYNTEQEIDTVVAALTELSADGKTDGRWDGRHTAV